MKAFAATLRHFVTINAPGTGRLPSGQPVVGLVEFDTAWANIATTGGLETIKAGAITSTVKVSIRMRYRLDLTNAMEIVHGTDTYKVLAVLPDTSGKKRHVDLVCEQNV
jgi:SPP1 family predicted phage head-tail adaptor